MKKRLISESVTNTTGTIRNATWVSFMNAGGASGSVNGVELPSGSSLSLPATDSNIYADIPYSAVGTTFLIHYTQ